MSYSVHQKCGDCKKEQKCSDGLIIKNAVQGLIHPMAFLGSHFGSGSVVHNCSMFEDKNVQEAPENAPA